MLINEVVEQQIDEYRLMRQYNGQQHIEHGNRLRTRLKRVKTPLQDFEVRYNRDFHYHDYYLYDPKTKQCVGLFTIEPGLYPLPSSVTRPGVQAVTPHIVLAPEVQRQGITTRIYTSFLSGGPWVFVTGAHTVAASRLWDSLAQGSTVSFFVDRRTGEPVIQPGKNDLRVLGPRDRFQHQVLAGL
jgi:hypothetical protein